jgi:hypothetical protein
MPCVQHVDLFPVASLSVGEDEQKHLRIYQGLFVSPFVSDQSLVAFYALRSSRPIPTYKAA